jgi:predicted phage tail protein
VVGALAVYRLTRLITEDTVLEEARDVITARGGAAAEFIHCSWCVSVWVAAAWAAATVAFPRTTRAVGTALAWSAVAGFLSEKE